MADIPPGVQLPDRNRMSVLSDICDFFQMLTDQSCCQNLHRFIFAENADNKLLESHRTMASERLKIVLWCLTIVAERHTINLNNL